MPTFLHTYYQECVNINTATKAGLNTCFVHHRSDVYPAHMFPQTGMHTHAQENTEMRGGAF